MGDIRNNAQRPLTPVQNVQAPLGPPPQVAPPPPPQPESRPPLDPPPQTPKSVSLTQPELIEQVIDNAPEPGTISETEQQLKPLRLNLQDKLSSSLGLEDQLKQARTQLKSFETDDRSGLNPVFQQQARQDTRSLTRNQIQQHDVQQMHHEVDLLPLFQSTQQRVAGFDKSFTSYLRSEEPQQYLQNHLGQALKRLDKAGASLFSAKSDIKKVVARTQQDVQQMVSQLSSQSNLSVFLQSQSEDELRQLVSEAVGQLKGYTPAETAQLSQKKQAFVEAVVKGIQAGLPQQDTTGLNGQGELIMDDQPEPLGEKLQAIQQALQNALGDVAPDSDLSWTLSLKSDQQLRGMLQDTLGVKKPLIFDRMLETLNSSLPNQARGSLTIPAEDKQVTVPARLNLNGESYGEPKYLAAGAFGSVVRYTNLQNPQEHVVVKVPTVKPDTPPDKLSEIHRDTVNEVIAHREIQGEGHPNIIGLKGVVKGPGEQLLIVMESAPHGNLYQGAHTLNEVTRKGLISEDTRQLLGTFFLRGVIQGTQHMQETRQSHHGDFKTPNILIGSDGEVKLTDFGTSGLGLTREAQSRTVDNPIWLAPELLETDFAGLSHRALAFAYDQVYQNFESQIEQILNLDLTFTKDNGEARHLNRTYNDETIQQDLNKALLSSNGPDHQHIKALTAQLKKAQPELSDDDAKAQAVEAYKAREPERIAQLTRQVTVEMCRSILNSGAKEIHDFSGFEELRQQAQSLSDQNHPLIAAYKQENVLTLQQAKMDTWGLGIVATELLLAPTTTDHREDSPHFEKLDLLQRFHTRIETSIKNFARNNERLSGLSEGLNVRTVAREMLSDPRFAGEAYEPMFRLLLGPEMPLPPAQDSSPEVLEAYQKDVTGYCLEHNLSPEAFGQKQGEYVQALQQFQAVLGEFEMGVTARDKLINGLLHPDPEKRITMSGALESSLFQDARLDMPELKQLWLELQKEKPRENEIQRLVGLLGN